jgi:hypothetical protein
MRPPHVVALIAIAACLPTCIAEQAYCAFEVKVTSSHGKPRSGVPVVVVQNRTTTFLQGITDANGLARLCDAPLESVDIAVGFDVCGLVLVKHLHQKWPETIRLFVTFDDHPCEHFVPPEFCHVLLRVRDPRGSALPGARFLPRPRTAVVEPTWRIHSAESIG